MIYVASKTRHAAWWRAFRSMGVPIISTWIDEAGPGETADKKELWQRIQGEVLKCKALVFYGDTFDPPHKGAFIEIGMALMEEKPVVIVFNGATEVEEAAPFLGTWLFHPLVYIAKNCDDAFKLCHALTSRDDVVDYHPV